MKIIVFSDSHRVVEPMIGAARLEKPDFALHLGDMEEDAEALARACPTAFLYNVCGNCDYVGRAPERLNIVLGGKRIFAAHGHTYHVKYGLGALVNTAMVAGADILLFGHTHARYHEELEGLIVANPGTVGGIRSAEKSYGLITIENGILRYENKIIGDM